VVIDKAGLGTEPLEIAFAHRREMLVPDRGFAADEPWKAERRGEEPAIAVL